jgi:hypothetical protein
MADQRRLTAGANRETVTQRRKVRQAFLGVSARTIFTGVMDGYD